MAETTKSPFELPKKLRFKHAQFLRADVDGKEIVFEPENIYSDLPASEYLFSLFKQGFFEEVVTPKKQQIKAEADQPKETQNTKQD